MPGGSGKGAKTLRDPATKCCVLTSKTYKDAIKKTEQNSSWCCMMKERTKCNGRKLKKRAAQTSYKKKLVLHEECQAVEQVSQRGCAVFVLGDV